MKVNTVFLAFLLLSVMLPLTQSTILSSAGSKNNGYSNGNGHDRDSSRGSKGGHGRDSDSGSRSGSKPYQPPVVRPPVVIPPVRPPPIITPPIIRPPVVIPPVVIPPIVRPPPVVYPPVAVSPPTWSIINNFRNDQQCVLAINYLTTTYTIFRTVTIIQV